MEARDDFTLFGTTEREPETRILGAGSLTARFMNGNLGAIRFRGHEVLRAISFLIRDRDWGTCAPEISGLSFDETPDAFNVHYRARFRAPSGANLDCVLAIEGNASGKLLFSAEFRADGDFETARAGFTVLHPLKGVVGQPVTVTHSDGTIERSRWPDLIEPWQPFMDIAAIEHSVAKGLSAVTAFSGDTFEMEDQRNWTDGSYKTYVRPLALPWPYLLKAGETIRQSVSLDIAAEAGVVAKVAADAISIGTVKTGRRHPEIGVGLRPEHSATDRDHAGIARDLGIRHLIAHFDPLAGHSPDDLANYAALAGATGLPVTLELAVPCKRPLDAELREIAEACRKAGLKPASLFVSPSVDRQSTPPGSIWPDCPPLEEVYAAARHAFPGVPLGGGMMSYFTELNRKRVPADRLDYINHCTNPIVHAADDPSVMQTFEALGDVVRSVRAIYPEKPYRIGPSTIAMRQNPYGNATKDNPSLGRIPMANVDPRHNGRFGAAWTLAYAATVVGAGLDTLTLSTLTGPFGLVADKGEPAPLGTLRPLAKIIAELAAMSGMYATAVESSDPSSVVGLGTGNTLLIANITGSTVKVRLDRAPAYINDIVDGNRIEASGNMLELPAYASARLRF